MNTFSFYQDNKITTWERNIFNIEAETKKEAIEILKDAAKKVSPNCTDFREPLFEGEYEQLSEVCEYLLPEDNKNEPTTEVYDNETGELLFDNLKNKL